MSLENFIKNSIGSEQWSYLTNIRRGGDNNQKGSEYEEYFAVATICKYVSLHLKGSESENKFYVDMDRLHQITVSSQELAFVDDFCVRDIFDSSKINYQAKNSSGASADWTDDIEARFTWQIKIDLEHFKVSKSQQVLLVSCPQKATINTDKIPSDLKDTCSSIFFPYLISSTTLIFNNPLLKESLQRVCNTKDMSNLDAAFRIVLSEWKVNSRSQKTIGDIISSAKAISKPDIFLDAIPTAKMMPNWLITKCESLKDVHYKVECGNFIVEYKGLNTCIGSNPQEPQQEQLDAISDSFDFINFLIQTYKIS